MITIKDAYDLRAYKGDVGIEIEVEGSHYAEAPKGWCSDYDGSLNNGVEYITSGGVLGKDISKRIATLEKAFNKAGTVVKPSIRCGVHVHVNVQNMSHKQVLTFATLYYTLEHILLDWCGKDRDGNLFCLSGTDGYGVFDTIREAVGRGDLRGTHTDDLRYAALNWKPITSYGSLEFRALATPKRFAKVAVWARMLLQLQRASLKYEHPTDIMVEFSGTNQEEFIHNQLGVYAGRFNIDYKHRKTEQMMRAGMYNAQDLAYMADWDDFEESVTHDYANQQHPQRDPRMPPQPMFFDELLDIEEDE